MSLVHFERKKKLVLGYLRSKIILLLKIERIHKSNKGVSLKLIKMRRTKGIDKTTQRRSSLKNDPTSEHGLPLVSEPLPTFVSSL